MQLGLLGHKIGMTQIFNKVGMVFPMTILKAGPCIVTQICLKTNKSIQIGYKKIAIKLLKKPQLGFFNKHNIQPVKYLKEFRFNKIQKFEIGQVLKIDGFQIGEFLNISGKTIGKGFSGLQKRYNFARGPMTHGSKNHRAPGSIGMGTTPGRVFPGKKMAGQLGNHFITIKKLEILRLDLNNNILGIKGSVPGKSGNLLRLISI
uniref:Large ribosomal subunit protein uL3c n=1 Tax=Nitzschia alba TaxID=2858 RepID=A0A5C0F4Z4_NITAL|nr:50S ribosomal protein L3 [Nitzschia alba]QEI59595.1 50S ribosomal protein L3 [Nitzschia alba]